MPIIKEEKENMTLKLRDETSKPLMPGYKKIEHGNNHANACCFKKRNKFTFKR